MIVPLCCAASLMLFISCENEGPAEKAGEKIDEAVEETKQNLEDAGDSMEEAVEETGGKLEDAGEKLQNQ